jgi:hypothetical protein
VAGYQRFELVEARAQAVDVEGDDFHGAPGLKKNERPNGNQHPSKKKI